MNCQFYQTEKVLNHKSENVNCFKNKIKVKRLLDTKAEHFKWLLTWGDGSTSIRRKDSGKEAGIRTKLEVDLL